MEGDDDPWGDGPIDSRQIGLEPRELSAVSTERTGREAYVWCTWEVGLGVQDGVMDHALIERVPHVARAKVVGGLCGNVAGHAEVVLVARKVLLAGHAERAVGIDTVGFVVARPDHVRLLGRDGAHLVVEVVQDALIGLVTFGIGRGAIDEALVRLGQPGVSVRQVTRMQQEVVGRLQARQTLDGVLLAGHQNVLGWDPGSGTRGQAFIAHRAHVDNDGRGVGGGVAQRPAGHEGEGTRRILLGPGDELGG
nr:hypothetical protein CFP56_01247 [Quercus suber]